MLRCGTPYQAEARNGLRTPEEKGCAEGREHGGRWREGADKPPAASGAARRRVHEEVTESEPEG